MEYERKWETWFRLIKSWKNRIDPSKFFTQTKYKGTRSHSMKLFKLRFQCELGRHAVNIDDWNYLTEKIVNSESSDIFKGRWDKHWSTEWFKISTKEYPTEIILILFLFFGYHRILFFNPFIDDDDDDCIIPSLHLHIFYQSSTEKCHDISGPDDW